MMAGVGEMAQEGGQIGTERGGFGGATSAESFPGSIHLHKSTWSCAGNTVGAGPSRSTSLTEAYPRARELSREDLWRPKHCHGMQCVPFWHSSIGTRGVTCPM